MAGADPDGGQLRVRHDHLDQGADQLAVQPDRRAGERCPVVLRRHDDDVLAVLPIADLLPDTVPDRGLVKGAQHPVDPRTGQQHLMPDHRDRTAGPVGDQECVQQRALAPRGQLKQAAFDLLRGAGDQGGQQRARLVGVGVQGDDPFEPAAERIEDGGADAGESDEHLGEVLGADHDVRLAVFDDRADAVGADQFL